MMDLQNRVELLEVLVQGLSIRLDDIEKDRGIHRCMSSTPRDWSKLSDKDIEKMVKDLK